MQRLEQLKKWLSDDVGVEPYTIEPASSDASFRRYFRISPEQGGLLDSRHKTLIVMDAPPEQEDTEPFIHIARLLAETGLNVPIIEQMDAEQGFLLLSDLGSVQYLSQLNEDSVDKLYADALDALLRLQSHGPRQANSLPPYDHELLWREMELFREWYLQHHLGLELNQEQYRLLDRTFETLAQSALEQPRVCVHRDYHSRNLMVTAENNPGILDFQDAVIGPVTYDLVSLLRDCYIAWPRERVESWALTYLQRAHEAGFVTETSETRLLRWFDWMGVQRHLKATGIFARLNYRDGKPGYLNDIPRTMAYVRDVASRYEALQAFNDFLQDVLPAA
jgi:aminoglycoside/choline kinase family phosphotransferase